MIVDIIQNIINYSDLRSQIKCSQIDSNTNNLLYIYSLNTRQTKINQKILEKKIFSRLKKLVCFQNETINDSHHLKDTLVELDCSGYYPDDHDCGIDQKGICELKYIKKLNCGDVHKINNVNHLKNTLVSLSGQPCTPVC